MLILHLGRGQGEGAPPQGTDGEDGISHSGSRERTPRTTVSEATQPMARPHPPPVQLRS